MNKITVIIFLLFSVISTAQTTIVMEEENGVYYVPCEVNGIPMNFIFDTGASNISISKTEAEFLIKQGLLTEEDFIEMVNYRIADGSIKEGVKVRLKEIVIKDIILKDITATVVTESSAPLLLGQSVLSKFGRIEVEGNILTIHKELEKVLVNEEKVIINVEDVTRIDGKFYLKYDMTLVTGKLRKWHENGQLELEVTVKNGKPVGVAKGWYEDRQLKFEGTYRDGKLHGVEKKWYENGKPWETVTWKDGKLDGIYKSWYKNRQLEFEQTYTEGESDGVHKWWYENGQLRSEKTFRDAKLVGVNKDWYENGQLKHETPFKNGKADGVSKYLNENGKLITEYNYKDGKYADGVSSKSWYEDGQLRREG
ncbi:MAG: TIGR02281 family clan AA aspartic protease, partial [Acidimicrobiia bacterium]|nr:TIGR02281 family clan AA aspartic protease [Acidimicrobiia bacterium]